MTYGGAVEGPEKVGSLNPWKTRERGPIDEEHDVLSSTRGLEQQRQAHVVSHMVMKSPPKRNETRGLALISTRPSFPLVQVHRSPTQQK
ncbi:hypothetical protein EYF80_055353 [Liparis tanakae]|uniref:Uncharacterized protein n=1 Tax=Liparis tanakae TaxID=230148 RepID=A0A4Z2EZS5_9TELE|nr:hypothetical protein EYF80_055353 [Liparis tanakae]